MTTHHHSTTSGVSTKYGCISLGQASQADRFLPERVADKLVYRTLTALRLGPIPTPR